MKAAILPPKESMSDSGEYYRMTCRFCETILTVTTEQAGTEIKCPDCFSMLEVGPPPKKSKSRPVGRGGRSWKDDEQSKSSEPTQSATPAARGAEDDEFKLSETFERPSVSPLFGLDASKDDLLAPRKKGSAQQASADETETPDRPAKPVSQPRRKTSPAPRKSEPVDEDAELDMDLPLPVDEVLSLEAIGTLDPNSELASGEAKPPKQQVVAGGKQHSKKKTKGKSSTPAETKSSRPKFKHANLFMATVTMLTDVRVLAAAGIAGVLMLIGGVSSQVIFPDFNAQDMTVTTAMYKYFVSFLFGCMPYYFGLMILWTVAGFVFRDAVHGHVKVQRWMATGQSDFWSSFLLFSFSFFIAGLPGAFFEMLYLPLVIPMRMIVAPLFLISAWFNYSPWQIVSTDWYHVIGENKSQWITVYSCFGGLALAGLLAGGVFLARSFTDLIAVDLILTTIGIGMNTVITLVFAAIVGWLTGSVMESLDQDI